MEKTIEERAYEFLVERHYGVIATIEDDNCDYIQQQAHIEGYIKGATAERELLKYELESKDRQIIMAGNLLAELNANSYAKDKLLAEAREAIKLLQEGEASLDRMGWKIVEQAIASIDLSLKQK